jgi:UDP-N-acetylglucosamine enolpyruvyl transferase
MRWTCGRVRPVSWPGWLPRAETVVTEIHHIDRGYPDFDRTLRSLGAHVERRPRA